MNLLIISNKATYNGIGKAGEKTHNYYLKAFAKEKNINVHLITVCPSDEYDKLDYDKYGIKNNILIENQDKQSVIIRSTIRAAGYVFNPRDKYANFVSVERRKFFIGSVFNLKARGYKPDCIILEFTHCILLAEDIKKIYPNVPIIGSSHDVSYKGSKRIYDYEKNIVKKVFRRRQYENLKLREVRSLSLLDCILTQNENDIQIMKENVELKNKNYHRIVPYYDLYSDITRKPDGKTIIFYGNMARKENYLSIIEFINNVFLKLDSDKRLVVIGGNPPNELKKYGSNQIHITGYLPFEEVKKYFASCECMVVPLLLGSGIKVKILEALSGAVPVVTNDVGNEGIFAKNGEQIVLCKKAKDFIDVLDNKTLSGQKLQKIGEKGKTFVYKEFDLEKSKENLISLIYNLEFRNDNTKNDIEEGESNYVK